MTAPFSAALESFNRGRIPGTFSFDEAMGWHFNHGFVFSTPRYFIMGRPVSSKAKPWDLWDYSKLFPESEQDAWFVALAAGNLSDAWAILPWKLPLIGFDREGEVRFYEIERVRRLTHPPTD